MPIRPETTHNRCESPRNGLEWSGMVRNGPPKKPLESSELAIVMPCLNEAETLGRCIEKAQAALAQLDIEGEVIVADNGSHDDSVAIARSYGVRVVSIEQKGYGAALQGGIEAAKAPFIIIGDADDSYDFGQIEPLVAALHAGHDLVMGNRFHGGICPGAMPWLHRYLGNPVLSQLGRWLFGCAVGDFHCGLRGFRKQAYQQLGLQALGMEFASEMVVKATLLKQRITEVPVTLYPDGRSRPSHLCTWRDGWRHLRLLLLYCPNWLFLVPGLLLVFLGTLGCALAASWEIPFPILHRLPILAAATLALFMGYQGILFGELAHATLVERAHANRGLAEGVRVATPRCLGNGLSPGGGLYFVGWFLLGTVCFGLHFSSAWFASAHGWLLTGLILAGLGLQTCLFNLLRTVLALAHTWNARSM